MQQRSYKKYLLSLLTIILTFNYLDRWALGIALEDIKTDLQLTDTQLGILTGIAFTVFYACMGIPIARWADRGNRVTIIAFTTALWSAAVALCGAAGSFLQLLAIRIGVAVGEAGCIPPAHSLIPEYFNRAERPRATAIYMLGVPLSLAIGFLAAGWLNQLYGWRVTFAILGLPGLVLAALAKFTLNEPREATAAMIVKRSSQSAGDVDEPSFKEVCMTLWISRAFRHLLFAVSIWYFFGYGLTQWIPAFFIRSYGLETGELGTWLGLIYGVGSGLGTYLGGVLAERFAAGKELLQLTACAMAFVFVAVIMSSTFLVRDLYQAFAALALVNFGGSMALGPIFATIQTLVLPRMRAMSIALLYMFANLIGMGLGPLAAGALSDSLQPQFGEESLRYALVILCPGYFWAAWHLWCASRAVVRDLQGAHIEDPAQVPTAVKIAVGE